MVSLTRSRADENVYEDARDYEIVIAAGGRMMIFRA
jgi:hypothetical protein